MFLPIMAIETTPTSKLKAGVSGGAVFGRDGRLPIEHPLPCRVIFRHCPHCLSGQPAVLAGRELKALDGVGVPQLHPYPAVYVHHDIRLIGVGVN